MKEKFAVFQVKPSLKMTQKSRLPNFKFFLDFCRIFVEIRLLEENFQRQWRFITVGFLTVNCSFTSEKSLKISEMEKIFHIQTSLLTFRAKL